MKISEFFASLIGDKDVEMSIPSVSTAETKADDEQPVAVSTAEKKPTEEQKPNEDMAKLLARISELELANKSLLTQTPVPETEKSVDDYILEVVGLQKGDKNGSN